MRTAKNTVRQKVRKCLYCGEDFISTKYKYCPQHRERKYASRVMRRNKLEKENRFLEWREGLFGYHGMEGMR